VRWVASVTGAPAVVAQLSPLGKEAEQEWQLLVRRERVRCSLGRPEMADGRNTGPCAQFDEMPQSDVRRPACAFPTGWDGRPPSQSHDITRPAERMTALSTPILVPGNKSGRWVLSTVEPDLGFKIRRR